MNNFAAVCNYFLTAPSPRKLVLRPCFLFGRCTAASTSVSGGGGGRATRDGQRCVLLLLAALLRDRCRGLCTGHSQSTAPHRVFRLARFSLCAAVCITPLTPLHPPYSLAVALVVAAARISQLLAMSDTKKKSKKEKKDEPTAAAPMDTETETTTAAEESTVEPHISPIASPLAVRTQNACCEWQRGWHG